MAVRWVAYLRGDIPPVDSQDVEQLECEWGIHFPAAYRQLVVKHQGMAPEPGAFDYRGIRDVFCELLTVSQSEERKSYSLRWTLESMRHYVPAGVYPFGTNGGGGTLCFDYRDSPPDQPRVVLVSEEAYIYPVADSFELFLEGLHDGDVGQA